MSEPAGASPSQVGPQLSRLAPTSSLRARAETEITAAIASGQMPAGQLFSAPALAARFGVSATPVREAMLNLHKRGLVDIVRNKGFRVTAVSEAELQAMVEVRQLLEAPAMRRVAERGLDPSTVDTLQVLAAEIVANATGGDLTRYLEADTTFHLTLLERAGNARLVAIVADLRSQTRLVGLVDMIGTAQLLRSAAEHHRLLELVLAGDADGAEELTRHHIQHVLGWWAGRPEPEPVPPERSTDARTTPDR